MQLLISADGTLHSPTLICFYEPKGAPGIFGDETMEFENLQCVWSKSGLFGAEHQVEWLSQLESEMPRGAHLMIDSWGGYKRGVERLDQEKLHVHIIPKKTTPVLQPLDVFFNRQLKTMIRVISEKIRRLYPHFTLSIRRNIARVMSEILHQFAAPRFKSFIRYSFFKAGYAIARPPPFLTPPVYCFDSYPPGTKCSEKGCHSISMIRCAHCENCICFDHFLIDHHTCES
jgi:hypothetical protein